MDNEEPWSEVEIAKRLIQIRKFTGLNQTRFAESIGVPTTNYNNWEKGRQRIPLDGAFLINRKWGTTLDFLYLGRLDTLPFEMREAFSLSVDSTDTITSNDNPEK